MSKVFTVLVFCVMILHFFVSAYRYRPWTKSSCDDNKVYRTGDSCEPTCYGASTICPREVIFDCLCDKGTYRTLDGKCVLDCSDDPLARTFSICGENEVIGTGDLCERSCYVNIKHCPPAHEHACICKEGFYRTLFGKCVADCSADEFVDH